MLEAQLGSGSVAPSTLLRDVEFVVIDLETTGIVPGSAGVIEVAAVKVVAGKTVDTFTSLTNPGADIPAAVTALTGITETMVASAPSIVAVLPRLLEFLRGAVVVAHHAAFDVEFLRSACEWHGHVWPEPPVLDTAVLARRLLSRDEVTNCKLATLAAHFGTATRPTHRARDDAYATVEVLHALFRRSGAKTLGALYGVMTRGRRSVPSQRRPPFLDVDVPSGPGVYVFRDRQGQALHVGASVSISARLRSLVEMVRQPPRLADMLSLVDHVQAIECAHQLDAKVRRLRLIAREQPPYQVRNEVAEAPTWLTVAAKKYLTVRLVAAAGAGAGAPTDRRIGPFISAVEAKLAADAIRAALVRTEVDGRRTASDGASGHVETDQFMELIAQLVDHNPATVVDRILSRTEQARPGLDDIGLRRALAALLRGLIRAERLDCLTRLPHVVAARRDTRGGWELAVIRHGVLIAAGIAEPGVNPRHVADRLDRAHTAPSAPDPGHPSAHSEGDLLLAWLDRPDVRLMTCPRGWAHPVAGAGRFADLLVRLETRSATRMP
jgi:DNA polymerase-3 subunit epsilon